MAKGKFTYIFLACILIFTITGCQGTTAEAPAADDAAVQQTAIAGSANATLTAQAGLAETEAPTLTSTPEVIITETPSASPTTDPASITHTIIPNTQISGVNVVSDTDSTNMASAGRALGGDDYSANLFERPFAADGMVYHPELDIKYASVGSDGNFYYVTINLSGVNTATGLLDGTYGIELDTDVDGRGEYMVLAFPQLTSDWSTTTLWAGDDLDGDVGGLHPMTADAPEGSTGYEETLFVYDQGADPDVAWARLGTQANTVQIAFKKSLIRGDADFLWSAWANGGDIDIRLQDTNDIYLPEEAGSPIQGVAYFPLNEVDLLDSTCRMAAGFTPVGNEPGLCANLRTNTGSSTVTPTPTNTQLTVVTVAPTEPPTTSTGSVTIFLFTDTNANGIVDGAETGYPNSDIQTNITQGACPGTTILDSYYRGGATLITYPAGWYCVSFTGPYTITPVNSSSFQIPAGGAIQINFGVVP